MSDLRKLIDRFNAARYLHGENERAISASSGVYKLAKEALAYELIGAAIVVRETGEQLTVLEANAAAETLTASNGQVYNFEDVDALA